MKHQWRQAWLEQEPDWLYRESIWPEGQKQLWKWWKCDVCGEVAHLYWFGYTESECKSTPEETSMPSASRQES